MELVLLVIGLILGWLIGWFIAKSKFKTSSEFTEADYNAQVEKVSELKTEKAVLEGKITDIKQAHTDDLGELGKIRGENIELKTQLTKAEADYKHLEEKLTEQKQEIERIQERFKEEFENLANRIFKDSAKEFTDKNKEKLDEILNPFKTKIDEFKGRVEQIHESEVKQREALKTEMTSILALNQQLSDDTNNLTKALKGDSKVIGDWGQLVLERILESSGLRKDEEYYLQKGFKNKEGKTAILDCLIKLPDDRDVIIDSKVSNADYQRYVASDDEGEQKKALKDHVAAVKKHIDELSAKDYYDIPDLNTLDYVIMVVPTEPAYLLALKEDPSLVNYAFSKGITLVSASNLVAIIKITSCLWQMEYQSRHVMDIADRGGLLYDKFVGFVEDLQAIGANLDKTKQVYEDSMNKLKTGSGNLIGQVEKLKKLGAKAKKQIQADLIESALENEDIPELPNETDNL